MSQSKEITELLEQLKNETGIAFQVAEDSMEDGEIVQGIKRLLNRGFSTENKDVFIRQILLNQLSEEKLQEGLIKFRLKPEPLAAFLLTFQTNMSTETLAILKNFLPLGATFFIEMNEKQLVVIQELKGEEFSFEEATLMMQDILNTEGMVSVEIAYDGIINKYEDLSKLYVHLQQAQKIGTVLVKDSSIYSYHEMGLGKLVYDLSDEAVDEYLMEHLGDFDFSTLDEEMVQIVTTFFENDLNMAETARSLYMHRNTLVYRLDKFEKQSGLDIRRFEDAITCYLAMMMRDRKTAESFEK